MAQKKGAGNKPQEYDPKDGEYCDEINFVPTAPTHFRERLSVAKASNSPETRWRVDVHDLSDYENDQLFLTEGGSCVAVEPSGNIISVCKNQSEDIRGRVLLKKAVESGGDRLDAFGEDLYGFYTRNGFEPVSYTPFNEEYAPEGWQKGREKPEPVIFYKYTGEKTSLSYDEFLSKTKPSAGYDVAKEIRDKEIKK